MTARSSLTIVLAAGEGTRMRSAMPKVLHPLAGQSLLSHVLEAAPKGTDAALAVVIGPDHKALADEIKRFRPEAATYVQRERLGTAHAVLAAREAIALNMGRRLGTDSFDLIREGLEVRSNHHGERGISSLRGSLQHMRKQRLAGQGMQHLWHCRAHARALAGREHGRETGSSGHPSPCIGGVMFAHGVINRFGGDRKRIRDARNNASLGSWRISC